MKKIKKMIENNNTKEADLMTIDTVLEKQGYNLEEIKDLSDKSYNYILANINKAIGNEKK